MYEVRSVNATHSDAKQFRLQFILLNENQLEE